MRNTVRMVTNAICELDVAEANGPDCIPLIVQKMCSPELSPVLAKLYSKCLFKSCFPSCCKFSSSFFLNVNDSISKYPEGTGLFSDLQYGFRAFRFSAALLEVLSERIYNSLDVSGETRAIALDMLDCYTS